MPPRPNCIGPRFSVTDLPILPFLAPRAFTSWPQALDSRRRYIASVPSQQDQASQRRADRAPNSDRRANNILSSSPFIDEDDALQDPAEQWIERLAKNQEESTKRHVRRKLNLGISHAEPDDEFQSKFDEVWGYAHHWGHETTPPEPTEHDSIAALEVQGGAIPLNPVDIRLDPGYNSTNSHARSIKNGPRPMTPQRRQRRAKRNAARRKRGPTIAQKSHGQNTQVAPPNRRDSEQLSERLGFVISGLRSRRRLQPPKTPHIDFPRYMLTKFAKIPSSVGQLRYAPCWNRRFALLISPYEKIPVNASLTEDDLSYDSAVQQLAENMLMCDSLQDIDQLWQTADPHVQEQWDSVIMWALQKNPLKTLDILVATSDESCPRHVMVDALEFIVVSHFVPTSIVEFQVASPKTANRILEGVRQMLIRRLDINLTQRTIFRLLRNLDGPRCVIFFNLLENQEIPLHKNTVFQFAWHLAKQGETETATKALELVHSFGVDLDTSLVKRVCSVILANHHRSQNSEISGFELFARMHALGIRPDLIIFNTLIHDALHMGDPEAAWNIHGIMEKSGIQADAHTYSHFLKHAKSSGDQGSLQKIVNSIKAKGIRNEYIATDLVHTVFFIYTRQLEEVNRATRQLELVYGSRGANGHGLRRPATPFRTMLSIYSEYFDMQPLKDLVPRYITVNKAAIRDPKPGVTPMQPGDQTLIIMLIGLLQDVTYPTALSLLYQDIKTLIAAGHPIALRLAKTEHLHNALLISLGKHGSLLPLCTDVVRNMLDNGVSSESDIATEEHEAREYSLDSTNKVSTHFEIAKPTTRTWTILLKIFLDRDQPRAAEKVLETMRTHKAKPNIVTYNTLIDAYAHHQDIEMTVDVIRRLQEEGLEPDEATMKSLSRIHDRDALNVALDKLVDVETEEIGKTQHSEWH